MGELGEGEVGVRKLLLSESEGILMISTKGDAELVGPAGPRPLFDGGVEIVDAAFLNATHQIVTVSDDGLIQTWSLTPRPRPSELINDPQNVYDLLGIGGGAVAISQNGKLKLRQAEENSKTSRGPCQVTPSRAQYPRTARWLRRR